MKHNGISPTTMKHTGNLYAKVLTNKKLQQPPLPITIHSCPDLITNLSCSLVGELAHIDTLPYIKTICHENGFPNLRIKYLSGFHILLQGNMSIQTDAILSNQTITNCFKTLQSWSRNILLKNLLAWLSIEGLTPQAWHEASFTLIAKDWGEIVFPEKAKTIITTWLLEKCAFLPAIWNTFNITFREILGECDDVFPIEKSLVTKDSDYGTQDDATTKHEPGQDNDGEDDDDGEDDFLDDESDGELFFNNDEFQN
ncbi:hypothetical protein Tco_1058953, partial [Tanacetum coccineum]